MKKQLIKPIKFEIVNDPEPMDKARWEWFIDFICKGLIEEDKKTQSEQNVRTEIV